MTIIFFKLRQKRQQSFLTGFAASMEVDDGRVFLRDRRVPMTTFQDGNLVERAQMLGDLELPADIENGWAAWGYPVDAPQWWDATPAAVTDETAAA